MSQTGSVYSAITRERRQMMRLLLWASFFAVLTIMLPSETGLSDPAVIRASFKGMALGSCVMGLVNPLYDWRLPRMFYYFIFPMNVAIFLLFVFSLPK